MALKIRHQIDLHIYIPTGCLAYIIYMLNATSIGMVFNVHMMTQFLNVNNSCTIPGIDIDSCIEGFMTKQYK